MWFMLTQDLLDPETQDPLHHVGHCLTFDDMKSLQRNYGIDHLVGTIILTDLAYDTIVTGLRLRQLDAAHEAQRLAHAARTQ